MKGDYTALWLFTALVFFMLFVFSPLARSMGWL